ncbi:type II secretion system protein [Sulfurimonas sp. SAG-AH-194-I05]|nr:type II secretion system protein [Sulfurimonas sp. SAG-AH-194-I05]MDF1874204.1 type II secretion system protein [Sulfurimonas sp. SAG-AH-194-I05]
MVRRYAFTMIELIFAIVIISIAMLSLPMMSQITSKNIENSLVQEAIFAASTELNQIVTFYWDASSMEGNSPLSRVVWTSNTDCDPVTKKRYGHINQPYHRRCTDGNFTALPATNTSDANINDLDDLSHANESIYIGDATSSTGYKKEYSSSITVTPNALFGASLIANPNIKKIRVIISDQSVTPPKNVVQLDTYSSNIGEIDYYKRTYE